MKNLLFPILTLCILILAACSGKEDEPVNLVTGYIEVEVEFTGEDAPLAPVDMSEYVVAIIPQSGWVFADYWKNIEWPLKAAVGRYAVSVSSPVISETDSEVKQFYGDTPLITVTEDATTKVKLQLKLTSFKKE